MILLKLAHTPAFAGYRAFVYLPPGKGGADAETEELIHGDP
jgi:hypothetical protein